MIKWKGEFYFEGNRRKYRFGIKDWLLTVLMYVALAALLIGLYLLNTFRWTI